MSSEKMTTAGSGGGPAAAVMNPNGDDGGQVRPPPPSPSHTSGNGTLHRPSDNPGGGGGNNAMAGEKHHNQPNGIVARDAVAAAPAMNGAQRPEPRTTASSSATNDIVKREPVAEPPPELTHIEEGFRPLAKLMERVAQECFNGLNDVVTEMADTASAPQQQQPSSNGIRPYPGGAVNGGHAVSPNEIQRRSLMMDWAKDQRDRFIKLRVLTDWSRQIDDISKLIDLFAWTNEQLVLHNTAAEWLGQMKINMAGAKLPRSDLSTALEVLKTGKASWMPAFNYVPLKPLTPEKILQTMRNLNASLHIRLNLHEDHIPHFPCTSIADGRATFTVPGEFEVDLSIADEDPTSQFFFIDIRLLFAPTPELPDGALRGQLESTLNAQLSADGLLGCYNFLHNFILTHKITILRRQAIVLSRESWSNSIRVEPVHRSLVIQYWKGIPAKKSWIEIGIASGKRERKPSESWKGPPISRLSLRWFREGVLIDLPSFEPSIDWTTLSTERILELVTAAHAHHILRTTRDLLVEDNTSLTAHYVGNGSGITTEQPPKLRLQFCGSPKKDIWIGAISGQLVISPPTPISFRTQHEINNTTFVDRAAETYRAVGRCLCVELQFQLDTIAERSAWHHLRHLRPNREDVQRVLKVSDGTSVSYLRPPGWARQFALAATINRAQFSVSLIQLSSSSENGTTLSWAMRLPTAKNRPITSTTLRTWARTATALAAFHTTGNDLATRRIQHAFRVEPSSTTSAAIPTLYIPLFQLVPPLRRSSTHTSRVSASQYVHVNFTSFAPHVSHEASKTDSTDTAAPDTSTPPSSSSSSSGTVSFTVRGIMHPPLSKDIQALLSTGGNKTNKDIAFHPSGAFALRVHTSFGGSLVDQTTAGLRGIARLRDIARALQRQRLAVTELTLSRVVFNYGESSTTEQGGSSEPLIATVTFGTHPTTLHLAPNNPHRRFQVWLQALLTSSDASTGFEMLCAALLTTASLCRGLEYLERKSLLPIATTSTVSGNTRGTGPLIIHTHNLTNLVLHWPLLPTAKFTLTGRRRRDEVIWCLHDAYFRPPQKVAPNMPQIPDPRPQALKDGLKRFFDATPGYPQSSAAASKAADGGKDDLHEMQTGVMTDAKGVEDVLKRLFDVVETAALAGPAPTPAPAGAGRGTPAGRGGGAGPQRGGANAAAAAGRGKGVIELD